jgi:hypothetical protein
VCRTVHGGRALLNLPGHHSTAAIIAEIEDTKPWGEGLARYGEKPNGYNVVPNITCKITDCDSAINIEFDIDTANSMENSIHKIDCMIDNLRKLRKGLIIEHHRTVDRAQHITEDRKHAQRFTRSTKFKRPANA